MPAASSSVDKENDAVDEDMQEDTPPLKLKKPKKGGKTKVPKEKLAAGMALMHAFSAPNVSGNRLTVCMVFADHCATLELHVAGEISRRPSVRRVQPRTSIRKDESRHETDAGARYVRQCAYGARPF